MPSITMYQRRTAAGRLRQQIAGLSIVATGANAYTVPAAQLDGLTPIVGDRLRTGDGVWRLVTVVGALADGLYPLTSEPEGGGS